jgi:uncharacterized protein
LADVRSTVPQWFAESVTPGEITASRPNQTGRRCGLFRAIRFAVLIYVGFLTVLFLFQDRMIFPGASTQGQPDAHVRPRADAELLELRTKAGERVVALFGPALTASGDFNRDAANRPTMIYFYGNGMCLNQATPEFDRFRRLGLDVLIPEYVGYGMSGGHPSEQACRATADAAYDFLVTTREVDPKRIISAGWSLGGAVAIDLAARRQFGGLFALSTFTNAVDVARRLVPVVPVSLLLRHRFDSLRKMAAIHCPILIAHGRRDSIIPFRMGESLAASARGPVTTLWIDQAAHKHFFENGGPQIDEAIATFIKAHVNTMPPSADGSVHFTCDVARTGPDS